MNWQRDMENTLQVNDPLPHSRAGWTEGLSANGRVNYVQQGKGMPVILTHGMAASLHDWDDLLPELSGSGFAGYALDLLGHGNSHKPEHYHEYTADSVFAHFEAWVSGLQLDEPMVLIGHSLGAGVSLRYASRYPDRVRALVLSNPFYEFRQLPLLLRTTLIRRLLHTRLLENTPYHLFRFFVDLTSFSFHVRQRKAHILPEPIRHRTAVDYRRSSSGIYNIPRTLPNLTADLSRILQPTLLLWGARDTTLDRASFPQLARFLPNVAGIHILPICGHVPHQCHPAIFNPYVMSFLQAL